jgi:transcriptional regulator with XRE-family HTH domain
MDSDWRRVKDAGMRIDDETSTDELRGGFGAALREWRRARGHSQLDLALEMGISARHLSFLETGRARPSRGMAAQVAEALMLPRAARNALLASAGFAPTYPATPLDAAALAPFRAMLDEMIARHAPYPALICNRYWTLLDANASARALVAGLAQNGETNLVRMLTENPRAGELIANYAEVLEDMAGRIRVEALEAGPDPVLVELLSGIDRAVARHPGPPAPRRPLAPLILKTPAGQLSFLSAIAHFGTSEDVTVRDLRLELFFPADNETRAAMAAFQPNPTPS